MASARTKSGSHAHRKHHQCLDPDIIVLGGGLSNITRLYNRVPPLLKPFVFSDSADTPIVAARHGDSSGVRGAAWLWEEPSGSGF